MARRIVVDTSVIVKWVSSDNEKHIKNANRLLEDVQAGKAELFAPELAKYEIGNVLLKGKKLSSEQAFVSLGTVNEIPIYYVPESKEISYSTYSIGLKSKMTYYDAAFVSLAKNLNAMLVTDNIKHQGKYKKVETIELKDYI